MNSEQVFALVESTDALQGYLVERFGVTADLSGHRLWLRRGRALWIAAAEVVVPPRATVEAVGLLVMREPLPRGQLSTGFIRRFCASATRNVCRLEGEALAGYLAGTPVPWTEGAPGTRIVFGDGQPLGRGRVRDGMLESELSSAYRIS